MANKKINPNTIPYNNSDTELFRRLMLPDEPGIKPLVDERSVKIDDHSNDVVYTEKDIELFGKLIDIEATGIKVEKEKIKRVKKNIRQAEPYTGDYTERDSELFNRLMDFDVDKGRKLKKEHNKQKIQTVVKTIKPAHVLYSETDVDIFEELIHVDNKDKGLKGYREKANKQYIEADKHISYSESDSEIFNRYMAFSGVTPDWISRIGSRNDRGKDDHKKIISKQSGLTGIHVKHIKVIDFDKERQTEKNRHKTSPGKVKVLYFD